ncbi:hypothetical protein Fcan01_02832 [Folsomia candida]|uniref:Uncharacterized protein n=1 Tax=Folsomia candida TaxID=158441 RepID=A0A226F378_FOLCA|nr:hypothetical protein Fcan01_02832 [Folsomia candida]
MVPYFREQQYDDDDSHSQCRQTAAAGEKSKLADCLCDKIKVHGLLQNHTPHAAAATLWPTMKGDNYDLIHLLTLYIYISFLGKLALRSESNFSLGDNLGYSFFSSRNKNALSRNFTVGTSSISHSPEVCGCGGDEDSEKADMVATLASFVEDDPSILNESSRHHEFNNGTTPMAAVATLKRHLRLASLPISLPIYIPTMSGMVGNFVIAFLLVILSSSSSSSFYHHRPPCLVIVVVLFVLSSLSSTLSCHRRRPPRLVIVVVVLLVLSLSSSSSSSCHCRRPPCLVIVVVLLLVLSLSSSSSSCHRRRPPCLVVVHLVLSSSTSSSSCHRRRRPPCLVIVVVLFVLSSLSSTLSCHRRRPLRLVVVIVHLVLSSSTSSSSCHRRRRPPCLVIVVVVLLVLSLSTSTLSCHRRRPPPRLVIVVVLFVLSSSTSTLSCHRRRPPCLVIVVLLVLSLSSSSLLLFDDDEEKIGVETSTGPAKEAVDDVLSVLSSAIDKIAWGLLAWFFCGFLSAWVGSVSGRWRRAVLAARGFLSGEGLGGGDDAGGRRVGFLEVILFFVALAIYEGAVLTSGVEMMGLGSAAFYCIQKQTAPRRFTTP